MNLALVIFFLTCLSAAVSLFFAAQSMTGMRILKKINSIEKEHRLGYVKYFSSINISYKNGFFSDIAGCCIITIGNDGILVRYTPPFSIFIPNFLIKWKDVAHFYEEMPSKIFVHTASGGFRFIFFGSVAEKFKEEAISRNILLKVD